MYIVWRQGPVKGRGGGPFLVGSSSPREDPACWKPLRCHHRGEGRIAHTALVVVSQRVEGKTSRKIRHRFPAIRTCCIADPFHRTAWWYDVKQVIRAWSESREGPLYEALSRDEDDVLSALREVVPKPGRAGIAEFTAYREARERDHAGRGRKHGDEAGPRRAPDFDGFAVLELERGATAEQVKARYRELAKLHHPDRGGDAAWFTKIQAAYEMALEAAARPSA